MIAQTEREDHHADALRTPALALCAEGEDLGARKGRRADAENAGRHRRGNEPRRIRRRQPARRGAGTDRRRCSGLRFDDHPRISRRQIPQTANAARHAGSPRKSAHDRGGLRHALRGDQLGPRRNRLLSPRIRGKGRLVQRRKLRLGRPVGRALRQRFGRIWQCARRRLSTGPLARPRQCEAGRRADGEGSPRQHRRHGAGRECAGTRSLQARISRPPA